MKLNLRLLYLYLFAFVGLLIVTIGSIRLVDLGLKTLIFRDADRYEVYVDKFPIAEGQVIESQEEIQARQDRELARNRQRELSGSVSMIVVGLPLYLYHWGIIRKTREE